MGALSLYDFSSEVRQINDSRDLTAAGMRKCYADFAKYLLHSDLSGAAL